MIPDFGRGFLRKIKNGHTMVEVKYAAAFVKSRRVRVSIAIFEDL